MTAGRRRTRIVTGLHVVSKRLASGQRWYVYAWRGGPCIHTADARPVIGSELLSKALQERQKGATGADAFEAIITAYRAAPEFEALADSTKRDYRLWLNRISASQNTHSWRRKSSNCWPNGTPLPWIIHAIFVCTNSSKSRRRVHRMQSR